MADLFGELGGLGLGGGDVRAGFCSRPFGLRPGLLGLAVRLV